MRLETEKDVNDWVSAAKALAVASAWSELGLFEALRGGAKLRTELAADPRALAVTIPVLAHVGILSSDGERVALTPTGAALLARGELPTGQNLGTLGDLSRTAAVLKDGGPVKDDKGQSKGTRGGTSATDVHHTSRFLDMLYRVSEKPAKAVYDYLAPGLKQDSHVLDLGGGHGRYARTFADGGHTVTIFDQPIVMEIAKKRHGDALAYLAGDFHEATSFGGPYDLILLANIVHGESAAQNASMLARAAKSLAPGGRIAIWDMFLGEHGHEPPQAVFFGVTMLFYTELGTSPTVAQTRGWLEAAGLGEFKLATFESHQLAVATKR